MQKLITFLCVITLKTTLIATSLIYTSNQTNYQAQHYVFRKNDTAQGFVRLNNGFTVLADSNARMDLLFSVSGAIDLRDTATMTLLNDLVCDSGVTLSSGGNIKGFGHSIFLNGNLTIPAGKVLHISGNTIINGQDNKLIIGANAQIFIDTNATLTLCNMSITNQQHAPTYPPIRCGAQTSKLALDNVVLAPVGDFLFPQGQLFIHDDVMVTGTSAFIYTSPMTSFITSGACWFFGINTTFSVAPATFTDAPYSLNNTYTNNNFIRMADSSATLYLDGCSLQTTLTGCRFTQGTIAFDNRITCKSDTTLTLTALSPRSSVTTGGNIYYIDWTPDGKYLAVGSNANPNQVTIYSFNGIALTSVATINYGTAGAYIHGLNWSPDGRYLAFGGNALASGYSTQVYSFNGSAATLAARLNLGASSYTSGVHWSPDGQYLAIGGSGASDHAEIHVCRFDGTSLTITTSRHSYSATAFSVKWSPDGKYLAVSGQSPSIANASVQVYGFDDSTLTTQPITANYGTYPYILAWNPDGRYLAVGGQNPAAATPYLTQLYRFTKTSLVFLPSASVTYGSSYVVTVSWSPDGRYFTIGGNGPTNSNELQTYLFDGTNSTLIPNAQFHFGTAAYAVAWNPNSRSIAVAGIGPAAGHRDTEVHSANFTNNAITQALPNSIVFGNSAQGALYDARVNILAGAHVNLVGAINYDC